MHAHLDQELQVTLQFFWGGKPIVVQTKGEGFAVELVMATLDHKMLASVSGNSSTTNRVGQQEGAQQ